MMLRMRAHTAYFTEMLPGVVVFGVGSPRRCRR